MRLACDTGGTFTDLVVEDDDGRFRLFKSPTTPHDPLEGVLDVVGLAARHFDGSVGDLLARTDLFIYATTWATNAILTNAIPKTAFLTTKGHPDILVFREGGRTEPFNSSRRYPDPYIPRSLTYEVPERLSSTGEIVTPLDEAAVSEILRSLEHQDIAAVAVCLLWSIVNPVHETKIANLLDRWLPGVPYTLSHKLNPILREYRRASATAIDASLKPVMSEYLAGLVRRLEEAGFRGRVLVVSSAGGVLDAAAVADAPIHSIGSGPAVAPVAGRYYARRDARADTAVIADAGGTSYDVSLVRRGRIPTTRETWLGQQYLGHMTGFSSVDVKSIGAGGGSIAWVDEGGLLHVGPQSAGAVPGPVCYQRGGSQPTVTDACAVLGYLDPGFFLGGAMQLDVEAATRAIHDKVGNRLRLDVRATAAAILELTTEHMVRAIEEITLGQGIDPRTAVLVGGGGAAGLNAVAIARRLGCNRVIIPHVAAALSAAGALMSDLTSDYATTLLTNSTRFDAEAVNQVLLDLRRQCDEFITGPGNGSVESSVELSVEARYPNQVWEIEVPLRVEGFSGPQDIRQLQDDFHSLHKDIFAISDVQSPVEMVSWRGRVRCRLRESEPESPTGLPLATPSASSRPVYFPGSGLVEAGIRMLSSLDPGVPVEGPAIIESAATTVVIDPGAVVERMETGSLSILPPGGREPAGVGGGGELGHV